MLGPRQWLGLCWDLGKGWGSAGTLAMAGAMLGPRQGLGLCWDLGKGWGYAGT